MTSFEPVCGIYTITNTVNQKLYLGSSVNIDNRWRQHRNELLRNNHHNKFLQRAWNKYGPDAFHFAIVELVLPPFLLERESYWLEKLRPYNPKKGYNIARDAQACHLGMIHSDEAREKMRIAHLGQKPSAEAITKAREANLGKRVSEETKERISQANLGHTVSAEARAKISAAKTGKPGHSHEVSPATRDKLRAANLGKPYKGQVKSLLVTPPDGGAEFLIHNVTQFCKEHGLSVTNLMNTALGKHSHCKGWRARLPE